MAQVIVRENESLESALKRFKRSCARDGGRVLLRDLRDLALATASWLSCVRESTTRSRA